MDTCDVARSRCGFRQGRKLEHAPWVLAEIEKQFGLEYSTLHPSRIFSFVALLPAVRERTSVFVRKSPLPTPPLVQ